MSYTGQLVAVVRKTLLDGHRSQDFQVQLGDFPIMLRVRHTLFFFFFFFFFLFLSLPAILSHTQTFFFVLHPCVCVCNV